MPVLVALLSVLALLVHPSPSAAAKAPAPAPRAAQPTHIEAPPQGYRYVGHGHVAIAVPTSWPNGHVECGADPHGVVVIDYVASNICQGVYPSVASVTITAASDVDLTGWRSVDAGIDGYPARREAVTCRGTGDEHICEGGVAIFDDDADGAAFVVRSPRGASYVTRVLSRVHTFRTALAVPAWQVPQAGAGSYASAYIALLTSSGRHVRTRWVKGHVAGAIVSVAPAVGRMLAPGATVSVTRAKPGPDDPPVGFQYVGIGRAVIAAPASFPIEHQECGDDAVFLDLDGPPCFPTEEPGTASIVVLHTYPGERFDHQHPGMVDGVRVYYTPVRSRTETESGTTTWSATAYVPRFHGTFSVSSTTSAAQVRKLLNGLHVLRHRAAVPFVHPSAGQPQLTVGKLDKALRALGLHSSLALAPGTNRGSPVASVSPAGGTLADLGTTATIRTQAPSH